MTSFLQQNLTRYIKYTLVFQYTYVIEDPKDPAPIAFVQQAAREEQFHTEYLNRTGTKPFHVLILDFTMLHWCPHMMFSAVLYCAVLVNAES